MRTCLALLLTTLALTGCAISHPPSVPHANVQLTPATEVTTDLLRLPPPKGKVAVAVYGFRDQTGQYKPAPESSFSTAVTQGATSMLIRALRDSGWFVPVERENLQNLLTERKIVRALEMPQPKETQPVQIPSLVAASILIEGGVVAFESNIRTGGVGARFLGIGMSTQYRVDQVTINLRSVDIRGGQVLHSISTTKTILSYEIRPSVFKFVNVKDLVEFEGGITRNEPAQLSVNEAIEAAVVHLVAQGVKDRSWVLRSEADINNVVLQRYMNERTTMYGREEMAEVEAGTSNLPRSLTPGSAPNIPGR